MRTDQAHRVADALLQQARESRATVLEAKAKPVPYCFRVRALAGHSRAAQAALVEAAGKTVGRDPVFLLAAVAWLGATYGAWQGFGSSSAVAAAAFFVAMPAGVTAIRTVFMRRALRSLAQP